MRVAYVVYFGPFYTMSIIFRGSCGSIENWLEHEIKPPSGNLACLNPWNALYQQKHPLPPPYKETHTHIHNHTLSLKQMNTHTFSLPFSLSLSLSHTQTSPQTHAQLQRHKDSVTQTHTRGNEWIPFLEEFFSWTKLYSQGDYHLNSSQWTIYYKELSKTIFTFFMCVLIKNYNLVKYVITYGNHIALISKRKNSCCTKNSLYPMFEIKKYIILNSSTHQICDVTFKTVHNSNP